MHLHRGPFGADDGLNVIASLNDVDASQVAIAFITDRPVNVAPFIGARSHWTLDLDGLVNLMINAGVGVTARTFEAKLVTTTRPAACSMTFSSCGPTDASLIDQPGRSAFVESPHRSSRPSRPSSASRDTSAGTPSTGVWSNL